MQFSSFINFQINLRNNEGFTKFKDFFITLINLLGFFFEVVGEVHPGFGELIVVDVSGKGIFGTVLDRILDAFSTSHNYFFGSFLESE